MKTYKVGGYVRDTLLGLDPKDVDYVIVGATEQDIKDLEDQGYKQVGADFPVYLHPKTGDEYALARTERKTGPGYSGFETYFDSSVTLEEDLKRRDLTINAMAMDEDGNIIDPYGGQEDLKLGILRHVSDAFAEDPLRVLRVARFMARYNFEIHEDTLMLMRTLARSGELDHLSKERIWIEIEKALGENYPELFFAALFVVGAGPILFPVWELTFCIQTVISIRKRFATRCKHSLYAALFWNWDERHDQLGVPNEYKKLALKVSKMMTWLSDNNDKGLKSSVGETWEYIKSLDPRRDTTTVMVALSVVKCLFEDVYVKPNEKSDLTFLEKHRDEIKAFMNVDEGEVAQRIQKEYTGDPKYLGTIIREHVRSEQEKEIYNCRNS